MRRLSLAVLALVVLPVAGACSSAASGASGGAPTTPAATVVLQGIAFHPVTVTVHPGDTVEWQWNDNGIVHNVIGDDGMHSPDQGGGTFFHRFRQAGTFNYQCSLHAGMTGTVIVG